MKKKKRVSRVKKGSTANWGHKGVSVGIPATVSVPAGRCPFTMEDASEETVTDWAVQLTRWKSPVVTYKRSVYTYWLRHSFDFQTDEYRDAKTIIEYIIPDSVQTVDDLIIDRSYLSAG
jgi:hypothetical protein